MFLKIFMTKQVYLNGIPDSVKKYDLMIDFSPYYIFLNCYKLYFLTVI